MNDLSVPILQIGLYVFVAFTAYVWILNRLAKFAQPMRLKMAEDGFLALNDGSLTGDERRAVLLSLNLAFNPWPAVVAAFLFPWAAIYFLVRALIAGKSKIRQRSPIVANISWKFLLSSMAANPLFGLVLLVELLAFMGVLILLGYQMEMIRLIALALTQFEERISSASHFRLAR